MFDRKTVLMYSGIEFQIKVSEKIYERVTK